MQANGLGYLLTHGKHRIERRHRLLKDHGDIGATDPLKLRRTLFAQLNHLAVPTTQQHLLALHLTTRLFNQSHQRQRGDRFS